MGGACIGVWLPNPEPCCNVPPWSSTHAVFPRHCDVCGYTGQLSTQLCTSSVVHCSLLQLLYITEAILEHSTCCSSHRLRYVDGARFYYCTIPSLVAVVFWSLILQNSLVVLCSAVLAVAFKFEISACSRDALYFGLVAVGVVIFGSSGNLATLGNTISIERDWVVAIAEKNELTLSGVCVRVCVCTCTCMYMYLCV